jgi:hypothetical protein
MFIAVNDANIAPPKDIIVAALLNHLGMQFTSSQAAPLSVSVKKVYAA